MKKRNLKFQQIPRKIPLNDFIFSNITGQQPATVLKMDSLTGIFQGFYQTFKKMFLIEHSEWLLPSRELK